MHNHNPSVASICTYPCLRFGCKLLHLTSSPPPFLVDAQVSSELCPETPPPTSHKEKQLYQPAPQLLPIKPARCHKTIHALNLAALSPNLNWTDMSKQSSMTHQGQVCCESGAQVTHTKLHITRNGCVCTMPRALDACASTC